MRFVWRPKSTKGGPERELSAWRVLARMPRWPPPKRKGRHRPTRCRPTLYRARGAQGSTKRFAIVDQVPIEVTFVPLGNSPRWGALECASARTTRWRKSPLGARAQGLLRRAGPSGRDHLHGSSQTALAGVSKSPIRSPLESANQADSVAHSAPSLSRRPA